MEQPIINCWNKTVDVHSIFTVLSVISKETFEGT